MVHSFSSNESSSSLVTVPATPTFLTQSEKRLLKYCKNNDQYKPETTKWNKKAVRCLLKTLKDNKTAIEELERAVAHQSSATKCIRMPKTYENRLLVSHRRGAPHVVFSRIWRWPDLKSHHQLNAILNCECSEAANRKEDNDPQIVCVNPYHYERKKPDIVPQVLVSILRIPPDLSTSFEDSNSNGQRTVSDRPQLPIQLTGAQVRQLLNERDHVVAGLLVPSKSRPTEVRTPSKASSLVASSSGVASGSAYTTSLNAQQIISIETASISPSPEKGQQHRKYEQHADKRNEPQKLPPRVSSQQNPSQASQPPPPPLPPKLGPDNHTSSSSSPLNQEDLIMWTPKHEMSPLMRPDAEDDEYDALFNCDASSVNLDQVPPLPVVAYSRVVGEASRVTHQSQRSRRSEEQSHRRPVGGQSQRSQPTVEHHKPSTTKQRSASKLQESTMGSDADNEYSGDADVHATLSRFEAGQQLYQKQSKTERPAHPPQEWVQERNPKAFKSSSGIQEEKMSQTKSPSSSLKSGTEPPVEQIDLEDDSLVAQLLNKMSLGDEDEAGREEGRPKFVKFGDTYQAINYMYEKATPFQFDRRAIQAENRQSRSKDRSRHSSMSSQLSIGTSLHQAADTSSQQAMSELPSQQVADTTESHDKVTNDTFAPEVVAAEEPPKEVQATAFQEVIESTSSQ